VCHRGSMHSSGYGHIADSVRAKLAVRITARFAVRRPSRRGEEAGSARFRVRRRVVVVVRNCQRSARSGGCGSRTSDDHAGSGTGIQASAGRWAGGRRYGSGWIAQPAMYLACTSGTPFMYLRWTCVLRLAAVYVTSSG